MKRLCIFFNTPSFYRESIYRKIDESFDCDWYFGDYTGGVKSFDIKLLNRVNILHVSNATHRVYWTWGLIRLLFDKRYDTYFTYGPTWDLCFWLFLLLKKLFFHGKKINIWCHAWYGKETFFESKMKRLMFNSVDRIFCYGEYARQMLLKMGYSPTKVCAVHNSLNYDRQLQIRSSLKSSDIYRSHFQNSNPVLLFIGRLTKVKRLDLLIKALCILKNEGQCYNLVLVGDGTERDLLQSMVEQYDLHSFVWFYGACYDEALNAELIYNADLCVAPGNVGLTAMHAMTFGTPVATHNEFKYQMPEFEAIIDGRTGMFFKYSDEKSIAEAISRWFSVHQKNREDVRLECYKEIEKNWTPDYQMNVIRDNLLM